MGKELTKQDDAGKYRMRRGAAKAAIRLKNEFSGDPYGKPLPLAKAMAEGHSTATLAQWARHSGSSSGVGVFNGFGPGKLKNKRNNPNLKKN